MSLESAIEISNETGEVIVQTGANNPNPDIEAIIHKNIGTYTGRKIMEANEAIKYLRYWEQILEHTGHLPKFRNYLQRNGIKPPIIKAYSAHTNLPEQVRAYSSPLLDGDQQKLEVIGIPADLEDRMKQDKDLLELTDEQLMHLYLVHELSHHALKHKPGYKGELDYAKKEGEVARLLFRYFKEESKKAPEVFNNYYRPLLKLTALQYIFHAYEQSRIIGNASVYNNALREVGIPRGFIIIIKTPKYQIN